MKSQQRATVPHRHHPKLSNARGGHVAVDPAMFHTPTCRRKIRYGKRTTARDAAARTSKRIGQPVVAYKCDFCGGYHVGHPD